MVEIQTADGHEGGDADPVGSIGQAFLGLVSHLQHEGTIAGGGRCQTSGEPWPPR